MKSGSIRCSNLLPCLAGASLLFAHPALSQDGAGVHPIPNGATAAAAAAEAAKEAEETNWKGKQDRFTFGKRHETVTTTDSTAAIEKNKPGSSDVTVSTGVFKESFLDVGLTSKAVTAASPTPHSEANPLRKTTTAVQSSASPPPGPSPAASNAAPLTTAPARLDITLGVSPPPSASATPPSR